MSYHGYEPWFDDSADYSTNARSYYDYLAKNKVFLKMFYDKVNKALNEMEMDIENFKKMTTAELKEFEKRLDNVQKEMIDLFNQWLADGVLDEVINQDILNSKADKKEMNFKGISISQYKHLFEGNDITKAVKKLLEDHKESEHIFIDFTPTGQYQLKRIDIENKDISLNGHGSTLLQVENEPLFNWIGGYDDIKIVQSVHFDRKGDEKSQTYLIMEDANHQFNKGDQIKLFSDDLIPERHKNNRFLGELCTIENIEGNKVILNNLLADPNSYTSNIKAVRINNKTFNIENMNFKVDKTVSGWENWTKSTVRTYGGVNNMFKNLTAYSSSGALLEIYSAYGYTAENIYAMNLPNEVSKSRWGYVVNDVGSIYGNVKNVTGMNVRHVYTTNSFQSNDNKGNVYSGRTLHATVQGKSFGGASAGFDTHPEAKFILFKDCLVENSGQGFQSRSTDTTFLRCKAEACRDSFLFTSANESTENNLSNNLLKDCESIRPNRSSVLQSSNATYPKGLTIDGGRFDVGNNQYGGLFNFKDNTTNITIKNALLYVPYENLLTGYTAFVMFGKELFLENIKIDVTFNRSDTTDIFVPRANTIVRGKNIEIIRGNPVGRLNKLLRGDDHQIDGKLKDVLIDTNIYGDLFTNMPEGSYIEVEEWGKK